MTASESAGRAAGVLLGAGGLLAGLGALGMHRSVRAWPVASGAVVHRGVTRVSAANLGAAAFQFTPCVRYRYVVEGCTYENETWYPAAVHRPPRGTKAWAQRLASHVPDVVPVRYDPARPSSAYLYLVPAWRLAAGTVAAGLMLVGALTL